MMLRVELRKKYYNGEQVKEVLEEFVTEYDEDIIKRAKEEEKNAEIQRDSAGT